ncbi:general stress protein [Qaidamihabitans albus]|uniref:general stress protein n=1 Tax=Qaidamihabitans albus TaxID=2795733 RepID=UPI0018F275DD|nr:general stress protein [Qaidamihabitans albus]
MSAQHETATRATPQEVVASYPDYEQAERAVDYLSDHEFPVQRTVIVGRGLDMVEQITGRYTYWSAAGRGAVTGAVVGALFGWIFGLFGWVSPVIGYLLLALYGAVFGAVVGAVLGALLGLAGHATTGGRRDFRSVPSFRAKSYQVLVDTEVAERARQTLAREGAPGIGDVESPRS